MLSMFMWSNMCSKYEKIFEQKYLVSNDRNLPEVHQIPAMNKNRRNALCQRKFQILKMNSHWSRIELGLLGAGDQVDGELLTLLELVTHANLAKLFQRKIF